MSFGAVLRRYRTQRGMSQERLAHEAEISTRHLSCLETGKAEPSRTMVLLLGSALDVSLRDRNALLEAAGFVAAYRDQPLDAPEADSLRRAVDLVRELRRSGGVHGRALAREILRPGGDEARMQRMFAALEAITELPPVRVATTTPHGPFLTVHLRRNGVEARIFSAVATIGTPIDATAEEITIETFFPADDATARLFHSAPPGAS